jgi:glucan 1,3-beta-glucosidase
MLLIRQLMLLSPLVFSVMALYDGISEVEAIVNTTNLSKRQSPSTPYWLETIAHQGISAFGPAGYQVFRNVKTFGAVGVSPQHQFRSLAQTAKISFIGDGVHDDTAAINAAISSGGRCSQGCSTTTTTPAIVYFPADTYLISSSIIDYYYTQLIGNANNPPTLKATTGFPASALIDGDKYFTSSLNWLSTNVVYRQIRNFVIDMTSIPPGIAAIGIHWPAAQATSIQNVVFQMNAAAGTQHWGLYIESGM